MNGNKLYVVQYFLYLQDADDPKQNKRVHTTPIYSNIFIMSDTCIFMPTEHILV